MNGRRVAVFLFLSAAATAAGQGIQITEIMYHPRSNEDQNEWVEIYNETSVRRDISGWAFAEGIDYVFAEGTILNPGAYLVIARDAAHIQATYGITNVVGPFTGRLNNSSDHIILFDNAGGVMAEVDYEDRGRWPAAADGTGHSLTKLHLRRDPMDADSWCASMMIGGTPGRPHSLDGWNEDTDVISVGETWRYFKGRSEASSPLDAWRQPGFDDSGWLEGPTGIGFGDGDDATVLDDMLGSYMSVFTRKAFTCDPSTLNRFMLEIDHDDGFIAYLNGTEVGRANMPFGITYNTPASNHEASGGSPNPQPPTLLDITAYKGLLGPTNVLAVQVHNYGLHSDDLSFIPRLFSRVLHTPDELFSPIVINEVGFNTSGTQYIELYNTSDAPVDVGGFCLSNDPNILDRFPIPAPTVVPGHGHVVFLQGQLGFVLDSLEDGILLTRPGLQRVVDSRVVEAGPLDMTEGRWPDGADTWYHMDPTTGTQNSVELTTTVVINEIMYHPRSDDDRDEYIELYNAGAAPVPLAGWRFSRGISFDFPSTVTIAPGQYLVLAKDRDRLIARYGLDPSIVLGNYGGRLANGGEKVRLRDANDNVADEVRYWDGGHWSGYADGYGSSLELIDPRQDNTNCQAWAPSDETAKAVWTRIVYSANINDTNTSSQEEDEFHFHLMAPGEVLIDDIHVTRGATEYLSDNGFEAGVGRWLIMGNHVRSHVTDTDAHSGSRCLRIMASGDGDTGANHIEQDATALMANNQTYTISFWVKWQYGCSLLVTRCYNNQAPETHQLPVPQNTGTPGAQNSVYRSNMGPVFGDVRHGPVVPVSSDPVTVRARIDDPQGIQSATLHYKADADASYIAAPMRDDGTGADEAAGDGVFAGEIPPRANGQTVAFYLEAADGLGASNNWPANTSRPALYRVDSGTWNSDFPTYRVVMTAASELDLFNGPHLSNNPRNCTFIFDEKDIYYNCGVRFTGSPYGRRDNRYRGYKVSFNNDERLHGVKWQARFDQQQNKGYRDRMSYHLLRMMGVPTCQVEWFDLRVNSRSEGIYEDILPPGRRYLDMFYRGDDYGELFELSARYYFTTDDDLNLSEFSAQGHSWADWGDDKDRYRWNFRVRNHDREDDYTTMIAAIKAFSRVPGGITDEEIGQVINVPQWLTITAVRTVCADWDFRGVKNAYVYFRPSTGLMDLLAWDCELAFGLRDTQMDLWSNASSRVRGFLQLGGNAHYYLNDVHKFMAHYFNHAFLDPWMDHYYAVGGGLSPSDFRRFINERRPYLVGRMAPYVSPSVSIAILRPDPLVVPDLTANLGGTAPVNASWVRVRGREYWLEWNGATHWYITIDVLPGTNLVTLEFLDYDKQPIGAASITIVAPGHGLEIEEWKAY